MPFPKKTKNGASTVTPAIEPEAEATGLLQPGECLVLKVVGPAGESYGDFIWPLLAGSAVEAPDWDPFPRDEGGLHGWLWGTGDASASGRIDSAKSRWLVLAVPEADCVDLSGEVKFPRCRVVYVAAKSGPEGRSECATLIHEHAPQGTAVIGVTLSGGDKSALTGGYNSRLTGGDGSTLTGGDKSILTGSYESTLTGGDKSILTGGYWSRLTGGNCSRLSGGDNSHLSGGNESTLTGGDYSRLSGGDNSRLFGGIGSTLSGGIGSILTGGYGSTISGGDKSTLTGDSKSRLTGSEYSRLTGGDWSTLTGGDWSTLTGGDYSRLTGGYGSVLTGGYESVLTGGNYSRLTGGRKSIIYAGKGSDLFFLFPGGCLAARVGKNGVFPATWYCIKKGRLTPVPSDDPRIPKEVK